MCQYACNTSERGQESEERLRALGNVPSRRRSMMLSRSTSRVLFWVSAMVIRCCAIQGEASGRNGAATGALATLGRKVGVEVVVA